MQLPDFTEFLNVLDAETISGIMRDANNAAKLTDENNTILEIDKPALEVMNLSFLMCVELLGVYHNWLEQTL